MKQYSNKRSVQLLAHLMKFYGVDHLVISPGSRNAPISIHFSEIEAFRCYSIVDERSAAFTALGMAQSLKRPVAATCTSGSAAANYYPAVTEAFYQNIPLLLLTADRPSDYVDLFDGQTIRQKNIFQQHSYGDFQLLEDSAENADDYNFATIKKAIELCIEKQGPVHINIPLEEPLYDLVSELPVMPDIENTLQKKNPELPGNILAEWNTAKRVLILTGSIPYSQELNMQLAQIVKNHSAVVLTEAGSNLVNEKFFGHTDRYIYSFSDEDFHRFAPDLLITVGQNVVSKKVKQFLRKAKPAKHWHIDPYWHPDTYFSLTTKIQSAPEVFFGKLVQQIRLEPQTYYNQWDSLRSKKDQKHNEYVQKTGYSDFYLFSLLWQLIPKEYHIHFSNSTAIRYAQLFDFNTHKIFCNRGTSGIDGSTSTAMGYAIASGNPTVLVTGELSFFYDINGLWNQYIPPYARIIVFNNGGGDIFKFIPGPSRAENALEEFIATSHRKTAEHFARHFGFSYVRVEDDGTLERVLENFFKPDTQPKILEVDTMEIENAEILKSYFEFLKD